MDKFLNMFRPPGGLVRSMWRLIALTIGCLTLSAMAPHTAKASDECVGEQGIVLTDTNRVTMKEQGRICDLSALTANSLCVGRDNSGYSAAPFNCKPSVSSLPEPRNSATEPIGWQDNDAAGMVDESPATNQIVWWRDYDQVSDDALCVLN